MSRVTSGGKVAKRKSGKESSGKWPRHCHPPGPGDEPTVQGCRTFFHSPRPQLAPRYGTSWRHKKDLPSTRWAPRRAAPGSRGDISVQHFYQGSSEPAPGAHTKTHSGWLECWEQADEPRGPGRGWRSSTVPGTDPARAASGEWAWRAQVRSRGCTLCPSSDAFLRWWTRAWRHQLPWLGLNDLSGGGGEPPTPPRQPNKPGIQRKRAITNWPAISKALLSGKNASQRFPPWGGTSWGTEVTNKKLN